MSSSALLALPADLALSVVRLLRGHDLVAVCLACRAWEMLVRGEEVWRKAALSRWSHWFGGSISLSAHRASRALPR